METQLQKTIEAASQIEEIISKEIPTAPKERTFWTTAVGIEDAIEMLRSNFEEAEKEICIILHHAYPQEECDFKSSEDTVAKEAIKAAERGVKIKALLNEEFIITEMEYLKELGVKEKIMDNVEIRAMKNATPSYFEVIDAEKVVLKVNNPKNPAQILAMTKIWDVKLAKEIRAIFEEMWKEAKPIKLT